jgi:hypothetical protein
MQETTQSGYDLQVLLGEAYYLFVGTILIISLYNIICTWIIFTKAGWQGWECIVPLYNIYVLFKIIGLPLSNLFWFFLPIVGPLVLIIKMVGRLSKSFGKGTGFAMGLFFLSPIFHGILAFSKSIHYVGPNGADANNQNNGTLDGNI